MGRKIHLRQLLSVLLVAGLSLFIGVLSASASTNYYVAPNGADSGKCDVQTSPCETIGYAATQASANNAGCQQQIINIAPGSYIESPSLVGHCNQLWIIGAGNTATQWSGVSNSCGTLIVNYGTQVILSNIFMSGMANPCQSILYAQGGGSIIVGSGMQFGGASMAHIDCENTGSTIIILNDYILSGGAQSHVSAIGGCGIGLGTINVNIQNGPTFNVFLSASDNATIDLDGVNWAGPTNTVTKYSATGNATINTFGRGCGSIPGGNTFTRTGGQCY